MEHEGFLRETRRSFYPIPPDFDYATEEPSSYSSRCKSINMILNIIIVVAAIAAVICLTCYYIFFTLPDPGIQKTFQTTSLVAASEQVDEIDSLDEQSPLILKKITKLAFNQLQ